MLLGQEIIFLNALQELEKYNNTINSKIKEMKPLIEPIGIKSYLENEEIEENNLQEPEDDHSIEGEITAQEGILFDDTET